jgi:hypothetical protein
MGAAVVALSRVLNFWSNNGTVYSDDLHVDSKVWCRALRMHRMIPAHIILLGSYPIKPQGYIFRFESCIPTAILLVSGLSSLVLTSNTSVKSASGLCWSVGTLTTQTTKELTEFMLILNTSLAFSFASLFVWATCVTNHFQCCMYVHCPNHFIICLHTMCAPEHMSFILDFVIGNIVSCWHCSGGTSLGCLGMTLDLR